ncbi:MAG: sigma-70 family RNA polymerase sigma factor [Chloroflexota bacterium]
MIAQMSHPHPFRGYVQWIAAFISFWRPGNVLMASVNIDSWVRQAQHGDASAVETLYQHHIEAIYRYIYYRVSSQRDAEDLTAEVFVKMVEGLSGYRFTGAPFEAWLYRIASARVIDYHRRNRRRPESDLDESLADTSIHPEDQIQRRQEIETLRNALRQLSDDEQTLLILRFVEHRSHIEAADIMGKTPTAVKAMQHRALIRLAGLLGSEEKVRHYLRGGQA